MTSWVNIVSKVLSIITLLSIFYQHFGLFHSTGNDRCLTLRTSNLPFRWSSEMRSANAMLPLLSLFELSNNSNVGFSSTSLVTQSQFWTTHVIPVNVAHCDGLNHHLAERVILPSCISVRDAKWLSGPKWFARAACHAYSERVVISLEAVLFFMSISYKMMLISYVSWLINPMNTSSIYHQQKL